MKFIQAEVIFELPVMYYENKIIRDGIVYLEQIIDVTGGKLGFVQVENFSYFQNPLEIMFESLSPSTSNARKTTTNINITGGTEAYQEI